MAGRGRAGGAGGAGGVEFQARLAAWFACAILAEAEATPLWDWPADSTFESVYAETDQPTDDLLVTNSDGARGFVQAKSRLSLTTGENSEFASALDQFVRQFHDGLSDADRLVLAVGPNASATIRSDLAQVLSLARGLSAGASLASANLSQKVRRALTVASEHIVRSWTATTGSAPTDAEVRAVLAKIWISVHDLADGGAAHREAQSLLRTTVLADPSQAGVVLGHMIADGIGYSSGQSGTDRRVLQTRLAQMCIALRAAPSYRDDVQRLIDHSSRTLASLARFASLPAPDGLTITIPRGATNALTTIVSQASVLVTGDPGAGKSAVLYEVARGAAADGGDVVVLAADTLASASVGQLRTELGLTRDIVDVLRNWPGVAPGLLVIDALDAARGEYGQEALMDLAGLVLQSGSRWRVVASIRRFDLRYSKELQTLFRGLPASVPPEYEFAEFADLAHFNVPRLTDDELGELPAGAADLSNVVEAAGSDLREILRTPFNLRLLADLVVSGVAGSEIAPITTQLQLLEKYWEHRVLGSGGDAREVVLRAACEAMVVGRTLRVDRSALLRDVSWSAPLGELLGRQVLLEDESGGTPRRELVAFAHHLLFDYAVARLLLRGADDAIVTRTRDSPELLLVVRPSYELHFRYLWERDPTREEFWAATFELAQSDGMPAIGRIIGPAVAADALGSVADAAPLLAARRSGAVRREVGESILRHLISARLAAGTLGASIPASKRRVWADLAAELANAMDEDVAYHVRNLLLELCTRASGDRSDLATALGPAARSLLAWSLDAEPYHPALTRVAISAVARTFGTDPGASEVLLRRLLDPDRLAAYGFMEFPELADGVEHLIPLAPELVVDVYRTALTHEEKSTESTTMGSSVVMPLRSNRRQDFDHSHYTLNLAFEQFLSEQPEHAIEALSQMRLARTERRATGITDQLPIAVPWGDDTIEIQPDGSYYWLTRDSHDLEDTTLDTFEQWVRDRPNTAPEDRALLDLLRSRVRPISLWRRVLRVAATDPDRLIPGLEPMLRAPEVLSSSELRPAICDVYRAAYSLLSQAARRRIERAILALPDTYAEPRVEDPARLRDLGEEARDQILACLPDADVVSAAARRRLTELRAHGVEDPGEQPDIEFGSRAFTERDHLHEMGVDVDDPVNVALQELAAPVDAFATKHLNERPTTAELNEIESRLAKLWAAVQTADSDVADAYQARRAWGHAAAAAACCAASNDLDVNSSLAALVTDILLASVEHPDPDVPTDPADFDKAPSWGSAQPRIEAAEGLPVLAWQSELATADVVAAINKLSQDSAAVVRFHIAQRLACLKHTAPAAMWTIANRLLTEDPSTAVLEALLSAWPRMVGTDVESLPPVIRAAFARVGDDRPGAERVQEHCVKAMMALYIRRGIEDAGAFIDEVVVGGLDEHPRYAARIVHQIRDALIYGDPDTPTSEADEVRRRAIVFTIDVLDAATTALTAWEEATAAERLTEEDPRLEQGKDLAHVIDGIAMDVYFATGAFDERQGRPSVTPAQRERLYAETGPLLDRLATVKYAPTAHHVIETFEAFIDYDPRAVFLRIASAIKSAQASRYQTDSLAAGLVVRLVERYLAEHRALLQQDDECRQALIEVLDLFVEAGWGEAMRLTYSLHDIYR
jgi:hypothetical protein